MLMSYMYHVVTSGSFPICFPFSSANVVSPQCIAIDACLSVIASSEKTYRASLSGLGK